MYLAIAAAHTDNRTVTRVSVLGLQQRVAAIRSSSPECDYCCCCCCCCCSRVQDHLLRKKHLAVSRGARSTTPSAPENNAKPFQKPSKTSWKTPRHQKLDSDHQTKEQQPFCIQCLHAHLWIRGFTQKPFFIRLHFQVARSARIPGNWLELGASASCQLEALRKSNTDISIPSRASREGGPLINFIGELSPSLKRQEI